MNLQFFCISLGCFTKVASVLYPNHTICVQQPIDFQVYAAECMLTLGSKVSRVISS